MATWFPVAGTAVQRVLSSGLPASGYVLKLYTPGTTTNIPIATDSTGNTQANYAVANATGDWTVSGNTIIPHINTDYKLCIYATQAAADADTGAVISIDNMALATIFVTPATIGFTNTATNIDAAVDAVETIKTSKGALLTSTGATWAALTAGTNTYVLSANSAAANGVEWVSLATLSLTATRETFNASNTKTLPANTAFIMYTVVAGGAGGGGGVVAGTGAGGGGAGGQVRTGLLIPAGNLTITVGAGGAGGAADAGGADGSNSVLTDGTTTITAYGGGQANGNNNGVGTASTNIAVSAGGGAGAGGPGGDAAQDNASYELPNDYAVNAGNPGGFGCDTGRPAGAGGPGLYCPLTDTYYGGGGGGGGGSAIGVGRHGGANGSATTGSAASANTGGGGGGGNGNNAGGNGGSGKVVLTYFVYAL